MVHRRCIKARYVFPVSATPIADGCVTLEGSHIVAVGPYRSTDSVECDEFCDFGNAAIVPGLVNAHAHLDLSDCTAPLGSPGIGLPDWIRLVKAHREREKGDSPHLCEAPFGPFRQMGTVPFFPTREARLLGLQESIRYGVTTLGDIVTSNWRDNEADAPINLTLFQELIAPTSERVADALELARSHLDVPVDPAVCLGLSPHAPYSVHPDLLGAVCVLAAAENVPVAMHLAESPEEMELLREGTGPFRTLLEELGAWDAAVHRPGRSPMDYLTLLATARRSLVIHGNYLNNEEMRFLGENVSRMAVVYCPRTHAWFQHAPYPLEKMLSSGVEVALGTDSRASSPDLDLFGEMRFATRRHPSVGLDRILRMGTLAGALALGWADRVGSIEPGKQADLAVMPLPDRDADDPHELLLESSGPPIASYACGLARCFSPDLPNRRPSSSSTSTNETSQQANKTSK